MVNSSQAFFFFILLLYPVYKKTEKVTDMYVAFFQWLLPSNPLNYKLQTTLDVDFRHFVYLVSMAILESLINLPI